MPAVVQRKAVEFATLEWVDWFNNRRLLEPIGGIPPAEAEAHDFAQAERAALAACLGSRRARYQNYFTSSRSVRTLSILVLSSFGNVANSAAGW